MLPCLLVPNPQILTLSLCSVSTDSFSTKALVKKVLINHCRPNFRCLWLKGIKVQERRIPYSLPALKSSPSYVRLQYKTSKQIFPWKRVQHMKLEEGNRELLVIAQKRVRSDAVT